MVTLSLAAATLAIARISLVRMLRSRAVWITFLLAFVPVPVATQLPWHEYLILFNVILAIVPPMYLASALAEEIEAGTTSYLWSRPFSRSAVVLGKLVAGVPIVVGMLSASLVCAYVLAPPEPGMALLWQALYGFGAGAVVACLVSIGLGSILPRQAMVASIGYLLFFDTSVGQVPLAINNITLSHHVQVLATRLGDGSVVAPLLWLAGLAATWLTVALWRATRAELGAVV